MTRRSHIELLCGIKQALQASWEPRYSIYCHKIPLQQYVRVGASLRHFGYTVVALHGCLQSEIQVLNQLVQERKIIT